MNEVCREPRRPETAATLRRRRGNSPPPVRRRPPPPCEVHEEAHVVVLVRLRPPDTEGRGYVPRHLLALVLGMLSAHAADLSGRVCFPISDMQLLSLLCSHPSCADVRSDGIHETVRSNGLS